MHVYLSKNDKQNLRAMGLYPRKCVICGKEFETRPGYVYKKYNKREYDYYCSYTCMRKAEKNG